MGLRITTNVAALNSHNALRRNDAGLTRSLERLSSGLRVNRAADDAAGLTISETLRTQVRGGLRASKNMQDAISMLNVADAGANEMMAIVQRMRELAVQAANGTLTTSDRAADQAEFTELGNQISQITGATSFNGIGVFLGAAGAPVNSGPRATTMSSPTVATNVSSQTGAVVAGLPLVAGNRVLTLGSPADVYGLGGANPSIVVTASGPGPATNIPFGAGGFTYNAGTQQVSINNAALAGFTNVQVTYVNQGALTNIPLGSTPIAGSTAVTANGAPIGAGGFTVAGNTLTINGASRPTATFPLTIGAGFTATGTTSMTLNTTNPFTGNGAIQLNNLAFNVNGAPVAFSQPADYTLTQAQVAQVGNTPLYSYNITFNNASIAAAAGAGQSTITASYDIDYPTINGPFQVTIQKGANNGETQVINLPPLNMGAGSLNLTATSLATQASAQTAITDLDKALSVLTSAREGYGADTNRLQHALNAVDAGVEDQASADSRIRDADMADQTVQLTRQQILTQSATETLRTAQTSPGMILRLLES